MSLKRAALYLGILTVGLLAFFITLTVWFSNARQLHREGVLRVPANALHPARQLPNTR